MTNADLEKIIASTEVAIRQAYALGRRDALDHVARWAQTTESSSTQLALAAPPEADAKSDAKSGARPEPGQTPPVVVTPAERAKTEDAATPRPRGFGALLLDYVYPTG